MKKFSFKLWSSWKSIAQKIGDFQIKIVFSLFYFLLITPLGFLVSLFKDYLGKAMPPGWQKIEDSFDEVEELKKQS